MLDAMEDIVFPVSKRETIEIMLFVMGKTFNVAIMQESLHSYIMLIHLHAENNPKDFLDTIIVTNTEWCYYSISGHSTQN